MKKPILYAVIAVILAGCASVYVLWTSSTDPTAAIERCERAGDQKQQCFLDMLVDAARHEGIGESLDVLALIYVRDRPFAEYCHGHTHEIGRIAYAYFSEGKDVSLSNKTSYCGFGFYHGFLEALFEETNDLMEARRFCEYADRTMTGELKGISFACYHGIGHGVVDGTDPTLWGDEDAYIRGGLELCDKFNEDEEHQERCASGVFNALAIAYGNPKFKLAPDPADPFAVCRKQKIRYAREACYDQMNGYVSAVSEDFAEALSLAIKAEPDYQRVAVESLSAYQARGALASGRPLEEFLRACESLPVQGAYCARGFAAGLMEFGNPGKEYEEAIAACVKAPLYAQYCLHGVSAGVRDRLDVRFHAAACEAVGKAGGDQAFRDCDSITKTGVLDL